MKYIFWGSPEFAATILEKLVSSGFMPDAVVCSLDKPFGRKKVLTAPAIKQLITNNKWPIEILQPEKINTPEFIKKLEQINADLFIVAAFAKIIPQEIINLPHLKTIGVHPSLLPKYRGASPIQSVILSGEKETGTTLFLIDEQIDHGQILATSNPVTCDNRNKEMKNYEELSRELAKISGDLLVKILPDFISGKIQPQKQDESLATYTKKFTTEDGQVNLKKDAPEIIYRKIKALNPDPGVFAVLKFNNKQTRLKLLNAQLSENNQLELLTVQPEGKKPMSYKDFLRGQHNC